MQVAKGLNFQTALGEHFVLAAFFLLLFHLIEEVQGLQRLIINLLPIQGILCSLWLL